MIVLPLKSLLFGSLLLLWLVASVGWWLGQRGKRPIIHHSADPLLRQQIAQHRAFIGTLSHELRTPLTALLAHTAIVRNQQSEAPVRDHSLLTLEREAQRMARLVRDLLELHRLELSEELPLVPVNVALLAEEAIASIWVMADEAQIELQFEADPTHQRVLAHPDRLKQVWLNLLMNCLRYCRAGDLVIVRVLASEQGLRCSIEDSGPGIAAADLPHVTEPLYRGVLDNEGSGLGLSLVKQILARHHSSLQIESSTSPPTGTHIWWILPYD